MCNYKKFLICSAAAVSLMAASSAFAAPKRGTISGGSASIEYNGKKTDIYQSTSKAIIDWRSFDIAPDEHTQFHQPSASAIALNRINDTKASAIDGRLTANGHIMLINPNGIVFGAGAQVDVGSLTASTADIDNDDFMAGRYTFNKPGKPDAAVVNKGTITAAEAGLVTLVAPRVENNGIIAAKLGRIQLAAADTFAIDMAGDGLIQVAVTGSEAQKIAANSGIISAEGGLVALTAAKARNIIDSVVENNGVIEAQSMTRQSGEIILGSGDTGLTVNRGVLEASGRKNAAQGGQVTVLGRHIAIASGSLIDASGRSKVPVPKEKPDTATLNTDKTVKTESEFLADDTRGGGSIKIGGDYLGSSDMPRAQTLYVDANSLTLNDGLGQGDGGRTIFWSDDTTDFNGLVFARGGINGGDGGFLETSGKINLIANGYADLTPLAGDYKKGTWLLDPANITIHGNEASVFNNAGLISFWDFNEGAGVTAEDRTNTNDGSVVNATYNATGRYGSSALEFNGTDTRVDLGNMEAGGAAGLTLSAWFKADDFGIHDARLISKADGVNTSDHTFMLSTISSGGEKLRFRLDTSSGATATLIAGGGNLVAGTWYHAAAVYDGVNMKLFLDGVEVGSAALTGTVDIDPTRNVYIGANPNNTRWFDGLIDDVGVFNTAIQGNELQELSGNRFTVDGLEFMSQTADVILQATNTITLDFQGDTLDLAGNRSLTLQTTNGSITDTSAGTINTTNADINIIAGGTGSIDLDTTNLNAGGTGVVNLTSANDIDLVQTGALNLGTVSGQNVNIRTTGGTADITLNNAVTSTAAGNSLTLASGRNFINNAGAAALNAGGGRWLVYSADPGANTLGGLSADFKRYNKTFAGYAPAAVTETGNGLFYSIAPILTVTADNLSKTAGQANPELTYTLSGLIGGDTASDVLTGALSTIATANSGKGTYDITIGSLLADLTLGYQLNFVPGVLTVNSDGSELGATLSASVQQQIQLPELLANDRYYEIIREHADYIKNDDNNGPQEEDKLVIKRTGTDIKTDTDEPHADVRLVTSGLLDIDQPVIDFYDLCTYNPNYCR